MSAEEVFESDLYVRLAGHNQTFSLLAGCFLLIAAYWLPFQIQKNKGIDKNSNRALADIGFYGGRLFFSYPFVTMPLKYLLHLPSPNYFFGVVHGLLFVLYVLAVVVVKIEQNWGLKKTFLALLASVIPFGTFWADHKLFKPAA